MTKATLGMNKTSFFFFLTFSLETWGLTELGKFFLMLGFKSKKNYLQPGILGTKQRDLWAILRVKVWDCGRGLRRAKRAGFPAAGGRESVRGQELRDSGGTWSESVFVHLDM